MSAARDGATVFFQLSGAGNDFLALVEPAREPTTDEIRAWCRRGVSLGADGVFTVAREGDAVRMRHYNADGSRGELCVNGSRCAARLAFELGWADGTLSLVTDAGTLGARDLDGDRVALALPPIIGAPEPVTFSVEGEALVGYRVPVGVPHLVLPWAEIATAPVAELGPLLRAHPDFGAAGVNVDFIDIVDRGRLEVRTFERGVEAETLACGSGVLAAVAVGLYVGKLDLPAVAMTAGGYELAVRGDTDGPPAEIEGDARILARGELRPEAGKVPASPRWRP